MPPTCRESAWSASPRTSSPPNSASGLLASAVSALPHTGVGTVPPAELVGQGLQNAAPTDTTVAAGIELEESPEVG